MSPGCGHLCCSTPGDPNHNHFLLPANCPLCDRHLDGQRRAQTKESK